MPAKSGGTKRKWYGKKACNGLRREALINFRKSQAAARLALPSRCQLRRESRRKRHPASEHMRADEVIDE